MPTTKPAPAHQTSLAPLKKAINQARARGAGNFASTVKNSALPFEKAVEMAVLDVFKEQSRPGGLLESRARDIAHSLSWILRMANEVATVLGRDQSPMLRHYRDRVGLLEESERLLRDEQRKADHRLSSERSRHKRAKRAIADLRQARADDAAAYKETAERLEQARLDAVAEAQAIIKQRDDTARLHAEAVSFLRDADQQNVGHKANVEALRQQLKESEDTTRACQEEIREVREESASWRDQLADMEKRAVTNAHMVEDLQTERDKLRQGVSDMDTAGRIAGKLNGELQDALKKGNDALETRNQDLQLALADNQKLALQLHDAQQSYAGAKKEIANLDAHKAELNGKLAREVEISRARLGDASEAVRRAQAAEESLATLQQRLDRQEQEFATALRGERDEIKALKQTRDEWEASARRARQEVATSNDDLDEAKRRHDGDQAAIKGLEQQRASLQRTLNERDADLAELRAGRERERREYLEARGVHDKEIMTATGRAEAAEEDARGYHRDRERLQRELVQSTKAAEGHYQATLAEIRLVERLQHDLCRATAAAASSNARRLELVLMIRGFRKSLAQHKTSIDVLTKGRHSDLEAYTRGRKMADEDHEARIGQFCETTAAAVLMITERASACRLAEAHAEQLGREIQEATERAEIAEMCTADAIGAAGRFHDEAAAAHECLAAALDRIATMQQQLTASITEYTNFPETARVLLAVRVMLFPPQG